MRHSVKDHLRALTVLSVFLACQIALIDGNSSQGYSASLFSKWSAYVASNPLASVHSSAHPNTISSRIALRLHRRLRKSGFGAPSFEMLVGAVLQRQDLLRKRTQVTFSTQEEPNHTTWLVSLSRYPLWLEPSFTQEKAVFEISPSRIQETLSHEKLVNVPSPVDVSLAAISVDKAEVQRAQIDGIAKPGYLIDQATTIQAVLSALYDAQESITIPLRYEAGRITNASGIDLGDLTLFSIGRSNFRGSPASRIANVRKALNEHVNNVLIPPGATFSFNETLGGPVNLGNGWRMAKVIYNGDEIREAPGGGICQVSTTVYRAVVGAGLPVTERRGHSIYVSYYKEGGVGIDATVYPGSQDLTFVNDTGNHLLLQAFDEGNDAYVLLYGSPDGREVALDGPYFASTAPQGFLVYGRKLGKSEIAWVQRVRYPDGRESDNVILTHYKTLPTGLSSQFTKIAPPGLTVSLAQP